MDNKNTKALSIGGIILGSAIIWGAVIIGCSLTLKGTECYSEIQNILVGGTFAHIILLGGAGSNLIRNAKQKAKNDAKGD
jgi:hypothetical protein